LLCTVPALPQEFMIVILRGSLDQGIRHNPMGKCMKMVKSLLVGSVLAAGIALAPSAAKAIEWKAVAVNNAGGYAFATGYDEEDARNAAKNRCERSTGRSCGQTTSVPKDWDLAAIMCDDVGSSGGSQHGRRQAIQQAENNAGGDCGGMTRCFRSADRDIYCCVRALLAGSPILYATTAPKRSGLFVVEVGNWSSARNVAVAAFLRLTTLGRPVLLNGCPTSPSIPALPKKAQPRRHAPGLAVLVEVAGIAYK